MTSSSRLNPRVQATIALILIAMFGGVLFLPALMPDFHPDADVRQTLLTLVVASVSFFLGSSSGSAAKEERAAALTEKLTEKK